MLGAQEGRNGGLGGSTHLWNKPFQISLGTWLRAGYGRLAPSPQTQQALGHHVVRSSAYLIGICSYPMFTRSPRSLVPTPQELPVSPYLWSFRTPAQGGGREQLTSHKLAGMVRWVWQRPASQSSSSASSGVSFQAWLPDPSRTGTTTDRSGAPPNPSSEVPIPPSSPFAGGLATFHSPLAVLQLLLGQPTGRLWLNIQPLRTRRALGTGISKVFMETRGGERIFAFVLLANPSGFTGR